MMLGELEEIQEEWRSNAESFTKEYLKKLSIEGNALSIDKLKEFYHSKTKNKAMPKQNDAFSFNDFVVVGNSSNNEAFFA